MVERVEPAMTTVGTRNDYYWDDKYGTWVYNLGTTTPPLGLNSEPRNVDESTVSPGDATKVVVAPVKPAKVPR